MFLPSSYRITLAADDAFLFEVAVIATRTDSNGETNIWRLSGGIDRYVSESPDTQLVGGTYVTDSSTLEEAAWTAVPTADTTNNSLKITVTGAASKTIRWVARVKLVKVKG
jgi:hypothetical protein